MRSIKALTWVSENDEYDGFRARGSYFQTQPWGVKPGSVARHVHGRPVRNERETPHDGVGGLAHGGVVGQYRVGTVVLGPAPEQLRRLLFGPAVGARGLDDRQPLDLLRQGPGEHHRHAAAQGMGHHRHGILLQVPEQTPPRPGRSLRAGNPVPGRPSRCRRDPEGPGTPRAAGRNPPCRRTPSRKSQLWQWSRLPWMKTQVSSLGSPLLQIVDRGTVHLEGAVTKARQQFRHLLLRHG